MGGRLQVFGTGAVRDCCSHRPANDTLSPPVPSAYLPIWRVSAFAPDRLLLILSFNSLLCSDDLLVGIAMHPVCVAAMPFRFRISHCHVGWDPLGLFTNSKTRRWYRSITIEIMILFHAPDPVPFSVPVSTLLFFKLSL